MKLENKTTPPWKNEYIPMPEEIGSPEFIEKRIEELKVRLEALRCRKKNLAENPAKNAEHINNFNQKIKEVEKELNDLSPKQTDLLK